MAVTRAVFQISTSDAALHERLADATQFVGSAADRDWAGIDTFLHTYDPVRWRAWTVSARAPQFLDVPGIVPAPAPAPGPVVALPEGVTLVADGSVDARKARAFLDDHPYVERLAALIGAQSVPRQRRMAVACLTALMRGLKALNVNLYALKPYRALCERMWGYFAGSDDRYWSGITGSEVNALLRGGVGNAATTWRRTAAAWWNANRQSASAGASRGLNFVGRVNFRDAVEPYNVVFGSPGGYDAGHHGCRVSSGGSITMPTGCVAPTAEQHTVWIQSNGSIAGGAFPQAEVDWRGWVFESIQWNAVDILGSLVGGRYRLFATPPLYLYWAMFYMPQPEFADASGNWRNFVEWMLAMPATEVIRSARVWVVQRNSHQAEVAGLASVSQLVGRAEQEAADAALDTERTISAVSGIFGGAAVGLAAAIPVAGLVVGGATFVGTAIARIAANAGSPDDLRTDVLGQLMPAFVQFAIVESRAALADELCQGVGWPSGVVPSGINVDCLSGNSDLVTEAMVTAAEAARYQGGFVQQVAYASGSRPPAPGTVALFTGFTPAVAALALQYAELRVDGMPRFGGVFLDDGAAPLQGRWLDPTERVWIVQAPRGRHALRVSPPTGGGPDRTVTLDIQGPTTVRFAEMAEAGAPGGPLPVVYEVPPAPPLPPVPPAPPAATEGSGGGWLVGTIVTLGLFGAGVAGWKHRRRLLGGARRG